MKKLSNAMIIAIVATLIAVTGVLAAINNGSFEAGDYTGWTKGQFINNGFSAATSSGGADLSTIVGGPAVVPLSLSDPNTNNIVKYPAYGHYSAKVNSELSYSGGGHAQNANTISQTNAAVLNPVDGLAHVRFTYAAVMVNPISHTADEKPYFRVKVVNASQGNDVIYDFSSYVGEPGKNWQTGIAFTGGDYWQYLDWTYVDLASTSAHPVSVGDNILVIITAAGCSPGGHPGYVYVDEVTDGDIAGPSIQATGPSTGTAGSTITYTYNYKNGSASAATLNVSITPPTNVTFTNVSDVNCIGTSPVVCTFSNVAAGSSGSFTVVGNISGSAGGTTIAHGVYDIGATGFPTVGGQTVLTTVPATIGNTLLNSVLPTSRSVPVGTAATFWNSILNVGPDTAYGVSLDLVSPPAGTYTYYHTDCATGSFIGGANPVVDIPPAPNNWYCYMISFTPSAVFSSTTVQVRAQSSNTPATTLMPGVNTITLQSTGVAGPDLIALSTTTDLHQIACSGTNAFAVAMSNVGGPASTNVTITAHTGSAVLPVSISIQETNPPTGVVIGDNILQNIISGDNRTAVVWVTFNGCISFDPAANRVFVEFRDGFNNLLGSTSTAISTNR